MTSSSLVKTVHLECMNSGIGRGLGILLLFCFVLLSFYFRLMQSLLLRLLFHILIHMNIKTLIKSLPVAEGLLQRLQDLGLT